MKSSIRSWTSAVAAIALVVSLIPSTASARRQAPAPNIVDIAVAVNQETGEFSTLIAALTSARLVMKLARRGQYTVFAPTDQAFADIGLDADNVDTIPRKALENILLYHVAPGRRDSGSVLGAERIIMLNGDFSFPSVTGDGAFINEAQLLAPDLIDIEATNGIIHVIDSVLMPE